MPFHKVIGIDLGTTYSAVSIWDGKDAQLIESATGSNTVPSVVGVDAEGQVTVGAPAQNNLVSDLDNTIIEVKREMGAYRRAPDARVNDPGEPVRIRFRDRDYLPQEISAFILMELKRQAEAFVGEPIHDAVITVPAYFKEPQRGATEDAARMARLNVKRLLNEPTAAAVSFGSDKVEDDRTHTYAVYDLGGGTFDVSIIEVSRGNVSVVGTGGDPRLGGGDFDDRITGYVLQQIHEKYGVDLSGDRTIWQRVKREAEMRKRELAVSAAATLNLPFLTQTLSVNIPITRAKFEELIKELLDKSLESLDSAIESAHEANGVERDEIEQVLLVGGSTRIACVRPMLAEHLGLDLKDIRSDVNPSEVVARGATMVAREFAPSDGYEGAELVIDHEQDGVALVAAEALVLQDVTSHTLGILVHTADFVPILAKDSRIPAENTQGGFTNGGAAKEIAVLIFQGEDRIAYNNDLIGKVSIVLPEAREAGYYRFEVTFGLDGDGLLKVEVKCLNDGQIWQTDLQCNVRATRQEIDGRSAQLASELAKPDSLPKPPAGRAPTRPALAPAPALKPPPEQVPAEFKAVARRSFKLVGQLSPPERERLATAYTAFVEAVLASSPEVEELGDVLDDTFHELK